MSSFESIKSHPALQAFPALQEVFDTAPNYGKAIEEINRAYRVGAPVVSDELYDGVLFPALAEIDPQHPFLSQVEPEPLDGATLVKHARPMLSTSKGYDQEAVDAYLGAVAKAASALGLKPDDLTYRITPKLDGIAAHDSGVQMVTRGDGLQGQDITGIIEHGVVVCGDRGLGKGELVCDQAFFDANLGLETPYKFDHARNFVAGFAGADTLKAHHYLALEAGAIRFVPFATLDGVTVSHDDLRTGWLDLYDRVIEGCEYGTDGIVVEVESRRLREAMGATSHHERAVLAIKQLSETAETTVQDIRLTTGRTGRIIPTLIVAPVRLSGATVSKVTAHTANNLVTLGLGCGARIQVTRSGEVIPKILKTIEKSNSPLVVTHCPCCGVEAVSDGEHTVCPNVGGCQAQTEAKLRHWFHTLANVDLFGPKTITVLADRSITDIPAVYRLRASDFQAFGFGPGQAANLESQLERSRQHPVADWRFLAAFGIRHLGKGDARRLLAQYPLASLEHISASDIAQIEGFGAITSPKIAASLCERWPEIAHMLALGFNLEVTPLASETPVADTGGLLAGEKVVFTGTMQHGKRSDMENQAGELGAEVQSGVNGQTTLLVIGDKAGSKLKKAEGINTKAGRDVITILSENDYLTRIA